MRKIITMAIVAALASCQTKPDNLLFQNDEFRVYGDKVVQGNHTATVLSSTEIESNYISSASRQFSRLVKFKISINEKDNEMPAGQDHWVVIGDEDVSPIKLFGQPDGDLPKSDPGFLPPNTVYTLRINMAPVLRQFSEKGYYQSFDGSKVARNDFKGFYVAGGSEPLTWDFVNLEEQLLQLKPINDSIYGITLTFNPLTAADTATRRWKLAVNLANKPQYQSEQPLVDALFNLSLEEALKNIEPDSTFRTGAKWGGVWTRDISYSILLSFAYAEPEVAKISLMKKVKRRRIVQDTGSGGAWPVSSDRTTWALAAWEIYKVTGDTTWLRNAFEIVRNTLDDDAKVVGITSSNLYSGESSFLDWREQTYPRWMDNKDIYMSENLGTNAVHYQAHNILAQMAAQLGEDGATYAATAITIRNGINQHLWMPDKGYYAQYAYGRLGAIISPRFEALGEALSVLFDVADKEKATSIFERSPVTPFGVSCIYPQIPNIPPYHNNGVWPFVQAFWNLAAAKAGNEKALNHGLASIYRAAGLFLTNYENFVAESGDFAGTEINSDRMLWSMAGNLAMVYRVFAGMEFLPNGIRFAPAVPKAYTGKKQLRNVAYRNAVLDIVVNGTGNTISAITLDGQPLPNAFFPSTVSGKHLIEITLNNKPFDKQDYKSVPNIFSPETPLAAISGRNLSWPAVAGAVQYHVYKNGTLFQKTTANTFTIPDAKFAMYSICAVDSKGFASFVSEPLRVNETAQQMIEMETIAPASKAAYVNFSGKGFIEISTSKNRLLAWTITVPEEGAYLLDFRYSNGSGPWNTDNKCALRSLFVNSTYLGTFVFPQRGKDEWSDWGYSNARIVKLNAGVNQLQLSLESWNTNMNEIVNTAMLDAVRFVKLQP